MEPRMPPQIPFARNSAASPSFARSPFAPAPTSSAPTTAVPTSSYSRPAPTTTSPAPTYPEHHQRRPSDANPFYASHPQSRPPPPYTAEPTSHPAQGHVRHHSSSSANHRAMRPPSPHQQQPPPPHQMGPYGGPPAPRPPPVNLGHPGPFPSGRELPALNSIARPANTGGSMSISSMLGGPPPAPREPTPGHAPPYPPPATTSTVSGSVYASSVHASPRMQNTAEYGSFHQRRPQTPEPGRPPFDGHNPRGSAAGSPARGIYGTPELSRYSTPQAYQQRPPPLPSADDNRREPAARVGTASVPPRPSSQPRSYHGMAPRSADMGRGPPPPHGEPVYPPREEGRPAVSDYNPERGPPRPMPYEDRHRLAAERERDYREHVNREAEFRERERRERLHFEEQRPPFIEYNGNGRHRIQRVRLGSIPRSIGPNPHHGNLYHITAGLILASRMPGSNDLGTNSLKEKHMVNHMQDTAQANSQRRLDLRMAAILPMLTSRRRNVSHPLANHHHSIMVPLQASLAHRRVTHLSLQTDIDLRRCTRSTRNTHNHVVDRLGSDPVTRAPLLRRLRTVAGQALPPLTLVEADLLTMAPLMRDHREVF
ncbi:putative histone deacetylation protein Rxt3 [Rosellinia necatrix]|uniref:Putative histone deacetylation protein Rxt3 n=1 Tax=Rosellinia necatrix TaxID=77044 RepID=A0A1W2TW03_ROSNE|nr:putative histone deacetylation protein Rxt3 [Rosellinia necatrix]